MPLTGDLAAFGKLGRLVRELGGVPSRASSALADRLTERMRDCFTTESDPYGVPWAPLKASTVRRKGGNAVVLYRTGETGASCYARPMGGAGVALTAGGAAVWHMTDSGTRPARKVLPDHGLPPAWREDVAAVLGAEVARSMGRATR